MEDECHKLDMEMAAHNTTQPGDRQSYTDYAGIIAKERILLDEQATVQKELDWLIQTFTLLTLNSSNPSTDPQVAAVKTLVGDKMNRNVNIVS